MRGCYRSFLHISKNAIGVLHISEDVVGESWLCQRMSLDVLHMSEDVVVESCIG